MYNILKGQTGAERKVITYKEKDSSFTKSSHYASMEEFWDFILTERVENMEWYQIAMGPRVYVDICPECNQYKTIGTSCTTCFPSSNFPPSERH